MPTIRALQRSIRKRFSKRICASSLMFSRIFPPRADMATDYHQSRLPAWILLPVIAASGISVLIGWATGSLFLGFVTVLIGAAAVAWWCGEMLRAVVGTM